MNVLKSRVVLSLAPLPPPQTADPAPVRLILYTAYQVEELASFEADSEDKAVLR